VDLASAAGTGNGDGGTAHIQINGTQIGAYSFGGIGFNTVLRTNLMASYLVPSNGVYQLALKFDRGYFQADVMNYANNLRISTAPIGAALDCTFHQRRLEWQPLGQLACYWPEITGGKISLAIRAVAMF